MHGNSGFSAERVGSNGPIGSPLVASLFDAPYVLILIWSAILAAACVRACVPNRGSAFT